MRGRVRSTQWPWLAGGLAAAFVLVLLHPRLVLTASVPAGYDLSGHIYPLWVTVHESIPRGTVHGWDMGWFGGFPVFYFYFPLPALLAALLTPLFGFLPAAKIVTALGMVMLPVVLAWFVRRSGVAGVAGALAVLVGSSSLLMQSHSWFGGNIASGLAGEFSFALGIALSLAYLATLPTEQRNRRSDLFLPGVFLAATALAHVVCVVAAVLASLPLLRKAEVRQAVLSSWLVGFALAAFWALPFVVRFEAVDVHRIAPRSWGEIFPRELLPLLPVAAGGLLWARRHAARLLLLLVPSAAALLLYLVPPGSVHPGRLLPYFFLTVHVLAGAGAGAVALWSIGRPTVRSVAAATLVTALLVWPQTMRDTSRLYGWAEWAYSGFTAKHSWPELERLLAELRRLPAGRVYWQDNAVAFAARGSRHLFTLLPYWSPGHDALRGLWAESSPLTETLDALDSEFAAAYANPDAHAAALQCADVLAKLSSLGARYFITLDARGAEMVMRSGLAAPLAEAGAFVVFGLPAAPLVTVPGQPHAVSALQVEDRLIRFRTTAPGVPHTIRVGYFANWTVSGAAGPIRVPPNYMNVVPTGPDVVLRFRPTWVELAGAAVTLAALAWLVALAFGVAVGARSPVPRSEP